MTAPLASPRGPLASTFAESERQEPNVRAPIDANGNLTSDGTRTFEWKARNQLVSITVTGWRGDTSPRNNMLRLSVRREGESSYTGKGRTEMPPDLQRIIRLTS
jgi:hypothetical protein